MTAPVRSFLPWYRAGYATALSGRPAAGAARAAVPVGIRLRGEPARGRVAGPLLLTGPGDVVALDRREVLRTEPHDGCVDFEPAYFPYVELASPDLPWRFSPEGPVQHRLQPWLALVVVPVDEGDVDGTTLRCDAAQLPDPGETWAWAHVQVTHAPGQPLAEAVTTPGATRARLLCPRRLDPGVRYHAALVPTYDAGRATILGRPGTDPLGPAWGQTGDVALPTYFRWTFRTGPEGSFEALVRRLRPRPVPATAGGRSIATGDPGWGARAASDEAEVVMHGALRPVGAVEPAADDAVLAAALRTAVSRTGADLQLRPPLYGQDYQRGIAALPEDAPGWLAELNTDPRRRIAAGLAGWAVAVDQEDLVDTAWQQLAAAGRPGDRALAAAVTGSLSERHGVPAGTPAAGEDDSPGFAPHYDRPAYELLRSLAPEWLLPALGDLPTDTVALAQTNSAFVESYLLGLNHALARELGWRRFPLRPDGTLFDRFWAGAAVPPIASWGADDQLGSHSPADDQLVLILKGGLLQRFPNAAVYLARPLPGDHEEQLLAAFSGRIGADCVFVGFPLTAAEALAAGEGGPGWSIVVQEAMGQARFGIDDPPGDGTSRPITTWQDLDAAHPHLAGRAHVPVAGVLAGVTRPLAQGSAVNATWGLDAAQQAVIVQQPAFRVRIPVALWLRTP